MITGSEIDWCMEVVFFSPMETFQVLNYLCQPTFQLLYHILHVKYLITIKPLGRSTVHKHLNLLNILKVYRFLFLALETNFMARRICLHRLIKHMVLYWVRKALKNKHKCVQKDAKEHVSQWNFLFSCV